MTAEDVLLFEATSAPQRSWTGRGFLVLALLLGAAGGATATLMIVLGAWPALGFIGLEVPAVLALVAVHHRRSGRASEVVSLSDGALRVRRTDGCGRREDASLEPYWTRVDLREDPGNSGLLRLTCRGRAVEVGVWLSGGEKRDLAAALEAALRRYREPRFDNPQLDG